MKRSDFIYLDHRGDKDTFAQCASCKMFLAKHKICSLHGKHVRIEPTMSCNVYCYGGPADESEMEHVSAAFTPEQSGLVNRPVRCENCRYLLGDNVCNLFAMLNLDPKVDKHGCCNANQPREERKTLKRL